MMARVLQQPTGGGFQYGTAAAEEMLGIAKLWTP